MQQSLRRTDQRVELEVRLLAGGFEFAVNVEIHVRVVDNANPQDVKKLHIAPHSMSVCVCFEPAPASRVSIRT